MADESDGGRKLRTKERKKYADQELDEDDIDGRRLYNVEDKLQSDKFKADLVQELTGPEFTLDWMQKNGLTRPIVFYDKTGLGLRVPSENFKVSDVKQCVGSRRILDVMDVSTQKGMEMSMKDWVKYYENPERDRLLNVISLEFCHTRLENYVESPTLVRQIDWVDRAWPKHLKECQTEATNAIEKMKYPKVQKYCLMSVANCYTDFHIDFGGTSVWYHILHGEKIFWLAPPTTKNIDRYMEWTLSAKQGESFLGDSLEQCQRINLREGYTFIIPSGWIHAVFTPKDSLVFGGNFLHSFNIENQLLASRIEEKTYVPAKFRYPFFSEIMWYVLDRYLSCLTGRTYLSHTEDHEEHFDDPGLIPVDEDSRPPSRNPDSRPPSRTMDDSMDGSKIKSESNEDAPKLSKSVTIELTRIDAALKRAQSEEEGGGHVGKRGGPRKATSDPVSLLDSGSKKWVHMTAIEMKGLGQLVDYLSGLLALPPSKRGVPKEMLDPEAVLREIRQVLEDHKNDSPELAITGEPSIFWPESAKKKQQKIKLGYKTFKATKGPKGAAPSSSSIRRRRTRCKQCEACTRTECGECTFCKDMKKFGGPGRMKQTCISRQCMAPILPSSSVCIVCSQEGQANLNDSDDMSMALMECGICWEIVHPSCLQKKYENLESDGNINEDLPNSWECSKCCQEGKQGTLKPRVRPGFSGKRPTSTKIEDRRSSADSDASPDEGHGEVGRTMSPMSPVEGKRVVFKEEVQSRSGSGGGGKEKTALWGKTKASPNSDHGGGKWKSEAAGRSTPPAAEDWHVKRGNGTAVSNGSGGRDVKRVVKKERMSAPNSPSNNNNNHHSQQEEPGRNARKRTSTPGSYNNQGAGGGTHHAKKDGSHAASEAIGKRPKREGLPLAPHDGTTYQHQKGADGSTTTGAVRIAEGRDEDAEEIRGTCVGGKKLQSSPRMSSVKTEVRSGMDMSCASYSPFPSSSSSSSSSSLPQPHVHATPPSTSSSVYHLQAPFSSSTHSSSYSSSGHQEHHTRVKQESAFGHESLGESAAHNFNYDASSSSASTVDRKPPLLSSYSDLSPEKMRWGVDYTPKVPLKNYLVRPPPPPPLHIPEHVMMTNDLPHLLTRSLWTHVFRHLTLADKARVSAVCRTFDCWVLDPSLWHDLDLSRRSIQAVHLRGVTIRQPRSLKLASAVVSQAQLSWLIARLPGLRHLDLSKLSWASICALCSADCPLLRSLHLSWATGIRDLCFRELASPPANLKPGQKNISRLCRLERLSLTGTDINDQSLETLATHLPKLMALDLTCCMRVTDRGIRALVQLGAPCRLQEIRLVKCVQLTERCLDSLGTCRELNFLALTDIPAISQEACIRFSRNYKHRTLRAHAKGIVSL